jgi:hypothetical protein
VASKKRLDVVPPDSQLTAVGKRSQDELEEVSEKDSSSSSQRKRPAKASPCATAAKHDFTEHFKSPKVSEVATPTGEPFYMAISKLGVKSLHLPAKAFV